MRTKSTEHWCRKLLFWQRILFLGLFLAWIMRIGTGITQLAVLEGQGIIVITLHLFRIVVTVAGIAYIIHQLHLSIESLKTYLTTETPISWQEVLTYQFYFWKYSCIALFVWAAWIAGFQLQTIFNL